MITSLTQAKLLAVSAGIASALCLVGDAGSSIASPASPSIDMTLSCRLSTVSGGGAFTVLAGATTRRNGNSGVTIRSTPNVLAALAYSIQPGKTLFVNSTECKKTGRAVALTPHRLTGGDVGSGNAVRCLTPSPILIRLYATLSGSRLIHGRVAITSKSGRPIAFASIRKGSVALYYASSVCSLTTLG